MGIADQESLEVNGPYDIWERSDPYVLTVRGVQRRAARTWTIKNLRRRVDMPSFTSFLDCSPCPTLTMSSCGPAGAGELNGGMDTCWRRFTLSLSCHCVSHVTAAMSQAHLQQPPLSFCAAERAFCVVLLAHLVVRLAPFVVALLNIVNFEICTAPLTNY